MLLGIKSKSRSGSRKSKTMTLTLSGTVWVLYECGSMDEWNGNRAVSIQVYNIYMLKLSGTE